MTKLYCAFALAFATIGSTFVTVKGCLPQPYSTNYPATYTYPAVGAGGYAGNSYGPYAHSKSRMAADTRVSNSADNEQQEDCFRRFAGYRLSCATPFERRTPSTEPECQAMCSQTGERCRSFQFESGTGSGVCDLFEVELAEQQPRQQLLGGQQQADMAESEDPVPPYPFDDEDEDTSSNGASSTSNHRQKRFILQNGVNPIAGNTGIAGSNQFNGLLKGLGFDPLGLSSMITPFAGAANTAQQQCAPKVEPSFGSIFVAFDPECFASGTSGSSEAMIPTPIKPPDVFRGGLEPFSASTRKSLPASFTNGDQQHKLFSGKAANNAHSLAEVIAEMPDCADGSRARIQLIDGIAIVATQRPIATIQLDSADACLHACRSNSYLDGTRFTRACRSATFHRTTKKCQIQDDAISPNGEFNYTPNPDSVYFEKFCIPEYELAMGCDDVVHRIPQHTLDTRAAGTGSVITTRAQVDCIRKCIVASKTLGFVCSSASFFFDWPADNCFLSRFTRINRPDLYVAERKQLVDYMEMPPCYSQQPQPKSNEGTSWERQYDDVNNKKIGNENIAKVTSNDNANLINSNSNNSNGYWSQWSDCDLHSGTQSRWRNCTGVRFSDCVGPRVQTVPCDSASPSQQSPTHQQKRQHNSFTADDLSELEQQPKQVAKSLEAAAKRYKPVTTRSSEASLFGEQDYTDQKEVSFFGPPHHVPTKSLQTTDLSLKKGNLDPLSIIDNDGVQSPVESESSNDKTKRCNPREECCMREEAEGAKRLLRGCSIGYQTLADGRSVPCLPEQCR